MRGENDDNMQINTFISTFRDEPDPDLAAVGGST